MESLRRPSVLAVVAAVLLVANVVLLTGRSSSDADPDPTAVGDTPAQDEGDGGTNDAPDAADDAGDGADAEATDDTASDEDTDTGADASDGGGATTGGDDAADAGDGGSGAGDGGPTPGGDGASGLAIPTAGTYDYASSGNWSFAAAGAETEEYQLPATATGVVTPDGSDWRLRLVAGDRYADEFGFLLGADGGLDWVDWVLERESPSLADATSYTCSGDSAHYRPDEQGRVATHVCETSGVTSTGSIEHTGTVDVTLGDGSVVAADQLLYTYTVEGDGVSGGGQLDMWLDPATGLRLKEVRTITTTGTNYEYREDVEFTLQSLTPS